MNTQEKATAVAVAAAFHTEAAQARVDELRAMRETIPNFTIPLSSREGQRLATVASVPPEFVELAAMVVKNTDVLAGGWVEADGMRDLVSFAGAYDPVADELEAMGHFLRHSTTAARSKAGRAALLVYAVIKRMAKMPEHADLAPYVADMSRALGMRERFARARAAAARRKAEAEAAAPEAVPPPAIVTEPHA
jgi:hypothetical protein